ncbi:MAG: hypothetical protein HC900_02485 [Methylacidiphilales bacterium]|nr:hypothetical protein [Candidatus Methylacidiphilales bacterium]
MAIRKDTLEQLLEGRDPKEVFSKDELVDEMKKALAERILKAELDEHLDAAAACGRRTGRNGYSKKSLLIEISKVGLPIPRDRESTFDPKLIRRYQRRFPGLDDKIVSMYARGLAVHDIQCRSRLGTQTARRAGSARSTTEVTAKTKVSPNSGSGLRCRNRKDATRAAAKLIGRSSRRACRSGQTRHHRRSARPAPWPSRRIHRQSR